MFRSFEIIILSFRSDCNSFVAACVYHPPPPRFLHYSISGIFSGFLSSIGSNFLICNDINVHLDVEYGDRSRFNDILQCCSLIQCVNCLTHIMGHTLDVLISPCNSDFVRNVSAGDFISDHTAIRSKGEVVFHECEMIKRPKYAQISNKLIYAYWVDCSNIPHPPLLTPPSVGCRWSVVFGSAPFKYRKLHILS